MIFHFYLSRVGLARQSYFYNVFIVLLLLLLPAFRHCYSWCLAVLVASETSSGGDNIFSVNHIVTFNNGYGAKLSELGPGCERVTSSAWA